MLRNFAGFFHVTSNFPQLPIFQPPSAIICHYIACRRHRKIKRDMLFHRSRMYVAKFCCFQWSVLSLSSVPLILSFTKILLKSDLTASASSFCGCFFSGVKS